MNPVELFLYRFFRLHRRIVRGIVAVQEVSTNFLDGLWHGWHSRRARRSRHLYDYDDYVPPERPAEPEKDDLSWLNPPPEEDEEEVEEKEEEEPSKKQIGFETEDDL